MTGHPMILVEMGAIDDDEAWDYNVYEFVVENNKSGFLKYIDIAVSLDAAADCATTYIKGYRSGFEAGAKVNAR